jgi:hypothetical protein
MMPSVSIILVATNRPKHLRNTLRSWCNIDYPFFEFSIIDNATECPEIEEVAEEFKESLHATFYKEPNWIIMNMLWNKYAKMSQGEYVIFAMQDEIVCGKDIIQKMVEFKESRASIFTYFMNRTETARLDSVLWQNDPTAISKPFTDQTTAGLISHITGGYRTYWDYFGWFRNEPRGHLWLDQDLHIREVRLGNACRTPEGVYCLHQWHPVSSQLPSDFMQAGYHYANEAQARLLESAERDAS